MLLLLLRFGYGCPDDKEGTVRFRRYRYKDEEGDDGCRLVTGTARTAMFVDPGRAPQVQDDDKDKVTTGYGAQRLTRTRKVRARGTDRRGQVRLDGPRRRRPKVRLQGRRYGRQVGLYVQVGYRWLGTVRYNGQGFG